MNSFIARTYAQALEILHVLFFIGMVIFTVYALNGAGSGRLSLWHIMLVYLVGVGAWIVIFGFITTVVVMADTLNEISNQNQIMAAFLQKIATSSGQATSGIPSLAAMHASDEPFIRTTELRE